MHIERGFSLMELLVTLLLLSFVMVTLTKMQKLLLNHDIATYQNTVALIRIESLKEHLVHNTNISPKIFNHWNEMNAELLPKAVGEWIQSKILLSWQTSSGRVQKEINIGTFRG